MNISKINYQNIYNLKEQDTQFINKNYSKHQNKFISGIQVYLSQLQNILNIVLSNDYNGNEEMSISKLLVYMMDQLHQVYTF